MARYTRELRVRYLGDPQLAASFLGQGRKLVDQVDFQRRGIAPGASLSRQFAGVTGERYRVFWVAGEPLLEIDVRPLEGRPLEEVVNLFITDSVEGLLIFDLGTKRLRLMFTGLQDYEVDAVGFRGRTVYLTGEQQVARVDLETEETLFMPYQVPDSDTGNTYFANVDSARLSFDGTTLVAAFAETRRSDNLLRDGLGGLVLADAPSLAPVREPIRMGYDPTACWSPDGRLFSAARLNTDSGTGLPDPNVATSTDEYIAVHDTNGTLLGTTLVATWAAAPSTANPSRIRALAATSSRLYVLLQRDPFAGGDPQLLIFDISEGLPAQVASLTLSTVPANNLPRSIGLSHGSVLALPLVNTDNGKIMEISVAEDTPEILHTTLRPEFSMAAVGGGTIDNQALARGATSLVGRPPDPRRFLLDKANEVFYGFRSFEDDPVYNFDLSAYSLNKRFQLTTVELRVLGE